MKPSERIEALYQEARAAFLAGPSVIHGDIVHYQGRVAEPYASDMRRKAVLAYLDEQHERDLERRRRHVRQALARLGEANNVWINLNLVLAGLPQCYVFEGSSPKHSRELIMAEAEREGLL